MFGTKPNQKNKKPVKSYEENQIERLRDLPGSIAQTVKQDLGKGFLAEAARQIAGFEKDVEKLSGDLKAGEALDLSQVGQKQQPQETYPDESFAQERYIKPALDYHREFRNTEKVLVKEDTKQIQVRIEQILFELKKLTSSSQELAVQFEEVTMEKAPEQAGTYHLNFFEWVFSVIRKARERIEESQTWLSLFKSKKTQRGYWNMFKKHGTMFGLSGERVVATQTG